MKKVTLISAFMALIFLTACSTPAQPTELPTTGDITTTMAPTLETLPAETTSPGYTLAEVNTHATTKDCRTAVDGKVYDITSAFGKHEGGDEALMKLCGKE
jgi:cytochrome b involved in lipid metabolism